MANIALITNNILSDSGTALTSVVTGSGTTNYLSKFTGSTALGNSIIYDNGTAVGIGTSSPSYKLNVIGESGFQGASAGTDGILNLFRGSSNTYGARIKALDSDGSVSFESIGDNANPNMYFKMRTLGASVTAMTITGAGNVGIGTTSPSAKLDVDGLIRSNRTSNTDGALILGTTGTYLYAADSGGYLASYTANLERLRITSSGNVLIGTTTDAGYKLQVSGIITFRDNDSYYQGFLEATSSNVYLGSLGTQNINLYSGGISYLFINGSNGNVGIGTTSPAAKLHINNSSSAATNLLTGNINGGTFFGWDADNTGLISTYTSAPIKFGGSYSSTFTEWMRIASSGNILIGTSTDAGQKLQVNGSGNFNLGNSGYIKLQSGSGQRHGFVQSAYSNFLFSNNVYYDGSNWRYDQNGYGAQIQTETLSVGVIAFNTFASGTGGSVATIIESMRIVNNGNILMGTTSDSGHKLQVNGTSKFTNSIYLTGTNRFIASGSSSQSVALYGGSAYSDGAYFNLTGNTYGASPGGGSAEFVIRTNSDSKFAMFGYNGSSWARYMTLFGPTGNMNIGYDTSDNGYKFTVQGTAFIEGDFRADGTSYFQNAIIQNYFTFNGNAIGGITSYQSQYNLSTFGNGNYSGETIDGVLATSVSAGQIVFLRPSGLLWELATASSVGAAATNMIGIACADGNYGDTVPILLNGFFASNSWYSMNFNYGVPMYLSTSSGQATTTAPSSTGNVIRILGHVNDYSNANGCVVMRFNPDNSWLVI